MDIQSVADAAKRYSEEVDRIGHRWIAWKETRGTILNVLQVACEQAKGFRIASGSEHINLDTIGLAELLRTTHVKFDYEADDGRTVHAGVTRVGSQLILRQCVDGRVDITIRYPHLRFGPMDDDVEPEYEEIGCFEPEELTEAKILDCATMFFQKLYEHETQRTQPQFKLGGMGFHFGLSSQET